MPMNVKLKFLLNIFIAYYFEHLAVQFNKGLNKCLWNWETEKPVGLYQAMYAVEMWCKHDALICFVRKERVITKPPTLTLDRTEGFRAKASAGIIALCGLATEKLNKHVAVNRPVRAAARSLCSTAKDKTIRS